MPTAVNEADFDDPNCQLEAEGMQWEGEPPRLRTASDNDPSNRRGYYYVRNGGLFWQRRAEFYDGDTLVRFSSRLDWRGQVKNQEEHMNSPWWLNNARFQDLMGRARDVGVPLLEMARRQLAIPQGWNSGDYLVVARPRVLLAAYSGHGLTAEAKGDRRIIASEAPGLWINQLYVPGLGRQPWLALPRPPRALSWLQFMRMRPIAEVERTFVL